MENCLIKTRTPNGYMAVLKDGWRFDGSQIVEAPTLIELNYKLATARCDDWKTINGAHVLIGKTGRILGGAGGVFTGKVFGEPFKGRKRVLKLQGKKGKLKEKGYSKKELAKLESDYNNAKAQHDSAVAGVDKLKKRYFYLSKKIDKLDTNTQEYTNALNEMKSVHAEIMGINNSAKELSDNLNNAAKALREYRDKAAKTGAPFVSNEYTDIIESAKVNKVKSVPVKRLDRQLTSDEIVAKIGGRDRTKGSCMSLAMTYIANKHGYDVLDFRGGSSQDVFSRGFKNLAKLDKAKGSITKVKKELAGAVDLLKTAETGKEYLFVVGRHASIVRNNNGKFEYLELQSSPQYNGWHELDKNVLVRRFSAAKSQRRVGGTKLESTIVMVDVDSYKNSKELPDIMQYINTNAGQEKKGAGGYAK